MLHAAVAPSLPATGVTFSVSGRFTTRLPEKVIEVVAVKKNVVSLYQTTSSAGSDADSDTPTLVHVMSVSLNAPPLAVAKCKPTGSPTDCLLMLFDDYHISCVRFNAVYLKLDTVGLVQLDERGTAMDGCPLDALLRLDATGSYAAVLVKRKALFFFPIVRLADSSTPLMALTEGGEGTASPANTTVASAANPAETRTKVALDAWGDEDDDDNDDDDDNEDVDKDENKKKDGEAVKAATATSGVESPAAAAATTPDAEGMILHLGPITHHVLSDVTPKLRNIRDIQFAESSGEPLLAFLYEEHPTWAGRVKLLEWRSRSVESHMLSCSIMWIRVTLAQSQAPKLLAIGDVDHLPYNSTHLTPLPAFGEVPSAMLCCGRNTLLHVNSQNGHGAFLNAAGKDEAESSRSPGSTITYAPTQWAAGTDRSALTVANLNLANALVLLVESAGATMRVLLFSEEEGTVVEARLEARGNVVSSIHVRVLMTGCMCSSYAALLPPARHFFLGSAKGDSYVAALVGSPAQLVIGQRLFGLGPIHDAELVDGGAATTTAAAAADGDEKEEEEDPVLQSPYAELFRNVSIEPSPTLSLSQRRARTDLAVASGMGASGAVHVLRQSVRSRTMWQEEANAVSVFFLDGAAGRKRPREDAGEEEGSAPAEGASAASAAAAAAAAAPAPGAHLLMTGMNFTILLAVRVGAVHQVRGAAFNIGARTVFAALLEWSGALLQVTEAELRLVAPDGKRKLQQTSFDGSHGPAQAAFVVSCDESVVVRFHSGALVRFHCPGGKSGAPAGTMIAEGVTAACLWAERGELVMLRGEDLVLLPVRGQSPSSAGERVFERFHLLPSAAVEGVPTAVEPLPAKLAAEALPAVRHLSVFDHHNHNSGTQTGAPVPSCSLVLLLASGELMTYRLFEADRYGPTRLLKESHCLLDVEAEREVIETIEARKRRLQQERAGIAHDSEAVRDCSERLVQLEHNEIAAGVRGVYVCGRHPLFLVYDAERQTLSPCRHQVPGAVRGFAPFRARNVPNGFVYCSEGSVYFATAESFGTFAGSGWWVQRVPLGVTPHRLVYLPSTQTCAVVTSRPEPFRPKRASFDVQLRIQHEEEGGRSVTVEEAPAFPPMSTGTGYPVAMGARFAVRSFRCCDWQPLERDALELEENETVLAARCVEVPRDTSMDLSTKAAVGPVCVLATAFALGEDVTSRGRVVLLAPCSGAGEVPGLRVLHSEPMRGPVTALAGVEGCVAVAVGGTIRVLRYDWAAKSLETMAMLYAGVYVSSLSAFRNYLVAGDLYDSVTLARFSATHHTLTVLGRHHNRFSVVHADVLYHDGAFGIVASDADRNLVVLGYTPRLREDGGAAAGGGSAAGGDKKVLEAMLTVDGEYRLPGGSLVKALRLRSLDSPVSKAVYVTNYGEIGFVVPLGEQMNRNGQWVARRAPAHMEHAAGLAPAMFLGLHATDPVHSLRAEHRLVQAELLGSIYRMDLRRRKKVCQLALSNIDRLLKVGATIAAEGNLF